MNSLETYPDFNASYAYSLFATICGVSVFVTNASPISLESNIILGQPNGTLVDILF